MKLPIYNLPRNKELRWFLRDTPEAWEKAKAAKRTLYEDHNIIYLFNSDGYRGSNFVDPGPEVFKLVVTGDDDTFGVGIAEYDTWVFQLARELASKHMIHIRHYNLALPDGVDILGGPTMKIFKELELTPDLVISEPPFFDWDLVNYHMNRCGDSFGPAYHWAYAGELAKSDAVLEAIHTFKARPTWRPWTLRP